MTFLLGAVLVYATVGAVVAIIFALAGVSRVLPRASITLGAWLHLMPGLVVFWPLIIGRWLKSRRNQ